MLRLEPRPQPSRFWSIGSPLLALALTVVVGMLLFTALGKDPVRGLQMFFVEPVKSFYAWGEIAIKATPLLLIALGLSVCFRSNVWNIGAEGQFVVGAIAAAGVALMAEPGGSRLWLVWVLSAGVLGGIFWAAIVAALRDRFNASEILVSLMLVYVAEMWLSYLVFGPWKDPAGFNFPQTRTFDASALVPRLISGSRANLGLLLALFGVVVLWIYLFRTRAGFAQQVGGLAPLAARYAGFSSRRALWTALLTSGALAGLAGLWRWRDRLDNSRPMSQPVMDLQPSSWPLSAACTHWAWCCRPFCSACSTSAESWRSRAWGCPKRSPVFSRVCCCFVCWPVTP